MNNLLNFISNNYVVVFFILAIGIKMALFNALVLKITWPLPQFLFGVICGFISVGVIFAPLYFARKHQAVIAIAVNCLLSTILLIDTVYYLYFSALPGIGLFSLIGEATGVGSAIIDLFNGWMLLYFLDIVLFIIFAKRIKVFFENLKVKNNLATPTRRMPIWAVGITLLVFGLSILPVGSNNLSTLTKSALENRVTAQYYGVLMAHAVDIARYIKQETSVASPAEKSAIIDWVIANKPKQSTSELNGIARGKNVILVQVESLGGIVIDQQVNGHDITPNLNELAKKSQFFPNNEFITGAGHSSDSDFVANTSYYPTIDTSVFVRYGRDNFTSLAKTLASNGYTTNAYHGYNRAFYNRETAINSLGYQKFYAAESYPKGQILNMGLNDGDFLNKTADYIATQPKPSLSYVITLSSHTPFETNNLTQNLGINIGDYPKQVGGYLENINYVDRMLGEFFTKLKSSGIYDDSLVVVYGDHMPILPAFNAGTINYAPDTNSDKHVPLFVKLPNETNGETHPGTGTSLDITPTIFDLLGIKTSQLMFGRSLFKTTPTNPACTSQFYIFAPGSDCNASLIEQKTKSSEIIQYNIFGELPE